MVGSREAQNMSLLMLHVQVWRILWPSVAIYIKRLYNKQVLRYGHGSVTSRPIRKSWQTTTNQPWGEINWRAPILDTKYLKILSQKNFWLEPHLSCDGHIWAVTQRGRDWQIEKRGRPISCYSYFINILMLSISKDYGPPYIMIVYPQPNIV